MTLSCLQIVKFVHFSANTCNEGKYSLGGCKYTFSTFKVFLDLQVGFWYNKIICLIVFSRVTMGWKVSINKRAEKIDFLKTNSVEIVPWHQERCGTCLLYSVHPSRHHKVSKSSLWLQIEYNLANIFAKQNEVHQVLLLLYWFDQFTSDHHGQIGSPVMRVMPARNTQEVHGRYSYHCTGVQVYTQVVVIHAFYALQLFMAWMLE